MDTWILSNNRLNKHVEKITLLYAYCKFVNELKDILWGKSQNHYL